MRQNLGVILVSEYLERKSLSDVGYKYSIGDLDDYTAKAFLYISSCFNENEKKELDKIKNKRR